MNHKTEGLARPCSANDIFLSGEGLQCGNCLATDRPDPKCTEMTPVELCRRVASGYYKASKHARAAAKDALTESTCSCGEPLYGRVRIHHCSHKEDS